VYENRKLNTYSDLEGRKREKAAKNYKIWRFITCCLHQILLELLNQIFGVGGI
jgi:hypothetical protein